MLPLGLGRGGREGESRCIVSSLTHTYATFGVFSGITVGLRTLRRKFKAHLGVIPQSVIPQICGRRQRFSGASTRSHRDSNLQAPASKLQGSSSESSRLLPDKVMEDPPPVTCPATSTSCHPTAHGIRTDSALEGLLEPPDSISATPVGYAWSLLLAHTVLQVQKRI